VYARIPTDWVKGLDRRNSETLPGGYYCLDLKYAYNGVPHKDRARARGRPYVRLMAGRGMMHGSYRDKAEEQVCEVRLWPVNFLFGFSGVRFRGIPRVEGDHSLTLGSSHQQSASSFLTSSLSSLAYFSINPWDNCHHPTHGPWHRPQHDLSNDIGVIASSIRNHRWYHGATLSNAHPFDGGDDVLSMHEQILTAGGRQDFTDTDTRPSPLQVVYVDLSVPYTCFPSILANF